MSVSYGFDAGQILVVSCCGSLKRREISGQVQQLSASEGVLNAVC